MSEETGRFWDGWWRRRITRRRLIGGGIGIAGLALIGCGAEEEEEATPAATTAPATGTAPATATAATATATATPVLTTTATVAAAGTPVAGGTLKLAGWSGGYVSWDPRFGDVWDPTAYYSFTSDRLVTYRYGPAYGPTDFTVAPGLGQSWEQPDELTVVFKLRQGVKWPNVDPVNGRDLNAEDIKFSYDQYRAPESSQAETIKPIQEITVQDPATLVFKTDSPFAPLLNNMANPHYPVIAREVISKFGTLKDQTTLIGTGPWYLGEYEPGQKAVFIRNQDYWRGPNGITSEQLPYLEQIEVTLDPEWQTTLAQFRSGELAAPGNWFGFWGLEGQDAKDIDQLRKDIPDMQEELHARPYMDRHIWMRSDKPPFDDVRIRQAASMGINRQGWFEQVYQKRSSFGREFAASNSWFLPNEQLGEGTKYQQYNPTEAKALLAAAGFPDGLETVLHTTTAVGPALQTESEFFAEEMRAIGINVQFDISADSAAWSTGPFAGKFDEGFAYGYGESFYDPDPFFDVFRPGNPKNRSHVDDATLSELLEKQRHLLDSQARKAAIDDIQRQTAVQLYYIVTVDPPQASAWHPWLKNWFMFDGADYGPTFIEAWIDRG